MQTRILAAVLCGCALTSAAVAETLVVNDEVQVRESQLERPKRGLTMDEVACLSFVQSPELLEEIFSTAKQIKEEIDG